MNEDKQDLSHTSRAPSVSWLSAKRSLVNPAIAISLLLAGLLGATIWAVSLAVTGSAEPWDAESPYYFVSLFVAGAIVGLLCPRHIWSAFLGIVAGQLVYLLVFLPSGPLLPLGVVFLLGYGLLSLLGAVLASKLRRRPDSIKACDGYRKQKTPPP